MSVEPGTVCLATVRGIPNVPVIRCDDNRPYKWTTAKSLLLADEVSDVRPAVVLDMNEIATAVEALGSHGLTDAKDRWATVVRWLRHEDNVAALAIADQIEAQVGRLKPAEPTGRYAVVVDKRGVEWLRGASGAWTSQGRTQAAPGAQFAMRQYADIDAVRVLSEGVPA